MKTKEVNSAPYPKSLERQFAQFTKGMINAMAKTYKNQTFKKLTKGDQEKFADAVGNYSAVFMGLSKTAKRSILNRFNNKRIDEIVKGILDKVNKSNQINTYKNVEKVIGIDIKELMRKEALTPEFNALKIETQEWVKKLRDNTLEEFQNNSLKAMTMGFDLDDVIKSFDLTLSKRSNAADLTARTQIGSYNGLVSKLRAQNLGVETAIWVTARNEGVRPCHEVRDGKEFNLAEGFFHSCDGKTLFPGTDFQCVCTYRMKIPTGEL